MNSLLFSLPSSFPVSSSLLPEDQYSLLDRIFPGVNVVIDMAKKNNMKVLLLVTRIENPKLNKERMNWTITPGK